MDKVLDQNRTKGVFTKLFLIKRISINDTDFLSEMLRKIESAPSQTSGSSSSRWKKLRTTVQIGSAMSAHYKKPPLKREDSFLQRFSTRPTSTPVDLDQPANDIKFTAVLNPDESLLFWWLWVRK